MKRKTSTYLPIVLITLFLSNALFAQQVKWPDSPELRKEAEKHNVIYYDAMQAKKFQEAANSLGWLLKNVPDLSEDIYKAAPKIYPELIKELSDATAKVAYQDTFLMSFDNRIKYYGNEAFVLNYKGYYLYPYYYNRPAEQENMYNTYKKIVELNGNKSYSPNVNYLMALASIRKKAEKISDTDYIALYEQLMTVADYNVKNDAAQKAAWEKSVEELNKYFAANVKITCDIINNNLAAKFKSNKTREEAEKLKRYLGAADCYSEPLFLEVMEFIAKDEPTYANFSVIGKIYESKKEHAKAKEFYAKAAEIGSNGAEKGKAYKEIMEIEFRIGAKASARAYAQKMMAQDPSQSGYGYTVIGNLYLGSGGDCADENPVLAKAYAIAAYEAYKKAGNQEKMGLAKKYFPSTEEIFQSTMGGKTVTLSCWIGETVTIPAP